jgi:hypothetical protein
MAYDDAYDVTTNVVSQRRGAVTGGGGGKRRAQPLNADTSPRLAPLADAHFIGRVRSVQPPIHTLHNTSGCSTIAVHPHAPLLATGSHRPFIEITDVRPSLAPSSVPAQTQAVGGASVLSRSFVFSFVLLLM